VSYEIAVFEVNKDEPAVVGGYTHVFVGRKSRKSAIVDERTREGLEALVVHTRRVAGDQLGSKL